MGLFDRLPEKVRVQIWRLVLVPSEEASERGLWNPTQRLRATQMLCLLPCHEPYYKLRKYLNRIGSHLQKVSLLQRFLPDKTQEYDSNKERQHHNRKVYSFIRHVNPRDVCEIGTHDPERLCCFRKHLSIDIILTCRQIHQEATSELYSGNVFLLGFGKADKFFRNFLDRLNASNARSIKHLLVTTDGLAMRQAQTNHFDRAFLEFPEDLWLRLSQRGISLKSLRIILSRTAFREQGWDGFRPFHWCLQNGYIEEDRDDLLDEWDELVEPKWIRDLKGEWWYLHGDDRGLQFLKNVLKIFPELEYLEVSGPEWQLPWASQRALQSILNWGREEHHHDPPLSWVLENYKRNTKLHCQHSEG